MSDRRDFEPRAADGPTGDAPHRPGAIAQNAANWVVRRDRGFTAAELREFTTWRNEDARHAAEFDRIAGAWRAMDAMGAAPELAALADEIVVRARARRAHRLRVRLAGFAAAAAAALVLGFVGWNQFRPDVRSFTPRLPSENYRVLPSTVQRLTLPDGSVAELNGASRVEVEFTATARRVRLVEGEAHFIVAPNAERPFFVMAGQVTVRAVGTAFNVRLASEEIEVLVTEGTVKLERGGQGTVEAAGASAEDDAAPALSIGQRAVISRAVAAPAPAIAIGEVDQAAIAATLGWQSTRLVFNNTPLDEVVDGFNRYNAQRLTLGDPKLRTRTLTGVFRADNLDGFLRLLKASVDVKGERRTPTETVLLPVR